MSSPASRLGFNSRSNNDRGERVRSVMPSEYATSEPALPRPGPTGMFCDFAR
jgi:hypothetical protein